MANDCFSPLETSTVNEWKTDTYAPPTTSLLPGFVYNPNCPPDILQIGCVSFPFRLQTRNLETFVTKHSNKKCRYSSPTPGFTLHTKPPTHPQSLINSEMFNHRLHPTPSTLLVKGLLPKSLPLEATLEACKTKHSAYSRSSSFPFIENAYAHNGQESSGEQIGGWADNMEAILFDSVPVVELIEALATCDEIGLQPNPQYNVSTNPRRYVDTRRLFSTNKMTYDGEENLGVLTMSVYAR